MKTLHIFLVVCLCCAVPYFNTADASSTTKMASQTTMSTNGTTMPALNSTTMGSTMQETSSNPSSTGTMKSTHPGTTPHNGGSCLLWSIYTVLLAAVAVLFKL